MSSLPEVEAPVNDDFFVSAIHGITQGVQICTLLTLSTKFSLLVFSLLPSGLLDLAEQSLMGLRLVEIPDSETSWCSIILKYAWPKMDRALLAQPQVRLGTIKSCHLRSKRQ